MQKITPHLWFDTQAKDAAKFYVSLFPKSKVTNVTTIHDTPSGDCDIVSFELANQKFMAISAGPLFKFNPSISFLVACKTKDEVIKLWEKLINGGKALMELGEYPFSEKYGWLQDKYGLSWQIMAMGDRKIVQKITPTMMFVGNVCGEAEEAMNFYASIFKDSKVENIFRYDKNQAPDKEGTVAHASFKLEGEHFAAVDSARMHKFAFNEAISFIVNCKDQKDVDYFWEKLSIGGEKGPCGWLKDKYGVSWQIVPTIMDKLMQDKNKKKRDAVMQAMMKMSKLDIKELEQAYKQAR